MSLINEKTLRDLGLLYSRNINDNDIKFSYFEDYPLIMPFKDAYGNVVGIVGRSLLPDDIRQEQNISKYKNTVFKKGNYLFGLFENKSSILAKQSVFVVEGQFDIIKAYEKGFTNIIALGNSNMTAYQLSVILRYTDNIFLLLDNDDAGIKGREKIMSKFKKFANIRNFYLPIGYKDIDEFLSENSYDDLVLGTEI